MCKCIVRLAANCNLSYAMADGLDVPKLAHDDEDDAEMEDEEDKDDRKPSEP